MIKHSIGIISPAKFPGTAGDSVTLTELVNQLICEAVDVTLICPKTNDMHLAPYSDRLHVIRIPCRPPRLKEMSGRIKVSQILRFIGFIVSESFVVVLHLKKRDIKYVIIRPSVLNIHLVPVLRFLGITLIADLTELLSDSLGLRLGSRLRTIVSKLEKRIMPYYSFFKVSSQSHAQVLHQFGIAEERIIHMPFSIDISKIPRIIFSDIPKNSFGYFGVLERWQGVDLLINAFEILARKIPSANLYIIGTGSLKGFIREEINKHNLSHAVTLVDSISRETLWGTYFKLFRVVVIPRPAQNNSIDNILPIKLVEAMAAAKPVIASNIPVMNEISKNAILLFNSGDPNSLAQCMEKLCDDSELLATLSENGLKFASKFDIRINIDKIISLLGDGSR